MTLEKLIRIARTNHLIWSGTSQADWDKLINLNSHAVQQYIEENQLRPNVLQYNAHEAYYPIVQPGYNFAVLRINNYTQGAPYSLYQLKQLPLLPTNHSIDFTLATTEFNSQRIPGELYSLDNIAIKLFVEAVESQYQPI